MPTNLTQWTNISDIGGLLTIANTNTGGIFWNATLWFLFIIIMISTISFGFEVALMGAAFISLVIGLFLLYMGLVSMSWTIGAFVGILLITFMWVVFNSRKES